MNHIDGCKINNNVPNLEWVTPKENIDHAIANGFHSCCGENATGCKLKASDVREIWELLKTMSATNIAPLYPVKRETISAIKCRKSWKHITKNLI